MIYVLSIASIKSTLYIVYPSDVYDVWYLRSLAPVNLMSAIFLEILFETTWKNVLVGSLPRFLTIALIVYSAYAPLRLIILSTLSSSNWP